MIGYFEGVLEAATFFISIFIIIYAFRFLNKSHRHRDRLPWELLIVATVVFMVQEAIAVIYLFQGREMVGVRSLLQAVFAALLLFTFALQHDLIHKQASIRIHNKHRVSKAEIQTP